jgi:hypothetical protein
MQNMLQQSINMDVVDQTSTPGAAVQETLIHGFIQSTQ